MKKLVFIISITFMVVGCHKKEIQLNQLISYLEKAQDGTLPLEQRIDFNNKASKLVLQLENKQDSLFFKHLFKIADTYYAIKELKAYKTTSESIVSYAQRAKDTTDIAKAYEYIGNYYKQHYLNDSAYCYYLKAEKNYTLVHDKGNAGRMVLEKASIQYHDGDLALSEILCLEVLRTFKTITPQNQHKRSIYGAYNLLGIIADDQQEYNKAIDYYNKSLEVLKKDATIINKDLLEINSLNNLGVAYRNKNENKEALLYFAQALELKELSEKAPHLYAMLLDNTAYSRFKIKEYTGGIENLFYNALLIRENLNLTSGIVMSKLHMSEYYQEQKDINKAFQLAQEAYNLAKTKKIDPRDVMRLLKQLQQVNAPLKEAYAIEYNRIADSLQQATPKIHEAITQELAQAKAKEEAEIKKEEKYKILFMGLGGIVCFLGLYYVIHRRKKQSIERAAKKKAELEANDRENRACLQEKETELQEKDAQIKIYNLMVAQHSKAKKRLNKQRFSLVKRFYDRLSHSILGQRLFLGTLKDKKAQVYSDDLKRLEEDLRGFYDFCNDIFQETQEAGHKHYLSLLHKLLNQQRKQTTVTDYIEVKWDHLDNALKMHLYRILENCFEVINQNKQITYVNVEMYDDDEEREGVIQLYMTCNEDLNVEELRGISQDVKKIGGLLQVNKHEEEGNTKLELFFATAGVEV